MTFYLEKFHLEKKINIGDSPHAYKMSHLGQMSRDLFSKLVKKYSKIYLFVLYFLCL